MDERRCVLVVLRGGSSLRCYEYPDAETAALVRRECERQRNVGRALVFNLRGQVFGAASEAIEAKLVTHLELLTRAEAEARGAWCRKAYTLS